MFDEKRILITGGAGFAGFHLCERLLGRGTKPYVLTITIPIEEALDDTLNKTIPYFDKLLSGSRSV